MASVLSRWATSQGAGQRAPVFPSEEDTGCEGNSGIPDRVASGGYPPEATRSGTLVSPKLLELFLVRGDNYRDRIQTHFLKVNQHFARGNTRKFVIHP